MDCNHQDCYHNALWLFLLINESRLVIPRLFSYADFAGLRSIEQPNCVSFSRIPEKQLKKKTNYFYCHCLRFIMQHEIGWSPGSCYLCVTLGKSQHIFASLLLLHLPFFLYFFSFFFFLSQRLSPEAGTLSYVFLVCLAPAGIVRCCCNTNKQIIITRDKKKKVSSLKYGSQGDWQREN